MTFAGIPWWGSLLLAAASAAVLAGLHLLRVRPRPVRVITTLFWGQALERPQARRLWERFRHPRTYVLLTVTAALLALALGRPKSTSDARETVSEVIVLDGGASMAAVAGADGATRIDAGRAIARSECRRLALNDRLAIVAADPWPRVIHAFDDPRAAAQRRLAEVRPGAAPAAREEALALARSLLRGRPNPRVVLITDRPVEQDAAASDDQGGDTRVVYVGGPAENAAIVAVTFVPAPGNPEQGQLVVRVGWWGRATRQTQVRVQRAGGALLGSQTVSLDPGVTQDVTIADVPADGDRLVIELAPADALAADDAMAWRLPLRRSIGVRMPGDEATALRLALTSDPAVRLVAAGEAADVEVAIGESTAEAKGPVIAVPASGPDVASGAIVVGEESAELTKGLDFEGAVCGSGAALANAFGTVLLRTEEGAVLAAWAESATAPRLLVAPALRAADGNAAARPALAVLMSRAVRRLAGWDDDPVVLPAERLLADPLWPQRSGENGTVSALLATRLTADLAQQGLERRAAAATGEERWSRPELFEVLLAIALVLLAVEGVLHSRGRIP